MLVLEAEVLAEISSTAKVMWRLSRRLSRQRGENEGYRTK